MKIDVLLDRLAAPARRAVTGAGMTTLEGLARHTEAEILGLHGIGPNAVAVIKGTLRENGMALKEEG